MTAASRSMLIGAAITLLVAGGLVAKHFTKKNIYRPIPAGFDFPADSRILLAARDQEDVPAMRRHAWMVFAGMTQPARWWDPHGEAVWETWYRDTEVFGTNPPPEDKHRLSRAFITLRQSEDHRGKIANPDEPAPLASFSLFNQETKDHIRDPQNKYFLRSTLDAVNAGFSSTVDPAKRAIRDFPVKAVAVKSGWFVVSGTGMTPMPIWDPESQDLTDPAPPQPQSIWKRIVLVDPSRDVIPEHETRDVTFRGKEFPGSHVVSLNSFYHFKVKTPGQADALKDFGAQIGDYMVLVGFHYTTKEISDWVWATFWWHDRPNLGPFAADRPDESKLQNPWRNYVMNVAYDMTKPKEPDGSPHVCFNPWLEAKSAKGANSNCMTCHQQAVWPSFKFQPVTRGAMAPDDKLFTNTTRLDFLWSFMYEPNSPGQRIPIKHDSHGELKQ
jgi:hypothetical protein